ncbi:Hypothetical protein CINCED_3A008179 [Cinara cedri]|uniref:Uncharacterized protein n=1 Tax=Cinara cedri TaxID=506608 RepID=A0A5E4NRB0_9HEMI|nr:Hypothetical protein CINCED_3A008179 [Cinara cedri]
MESKSQNGCRVLLKHGNLMRLLDLERQIIRRVDNIPIPISMNPISSNVNPSRETSSSYQTYSPLSPPSYTPASPSYSTPHVKDERGVDHDDGPFGPKYINPSNEEED